MNFSYPFSLIKLLFSQCCSFLRNSYLLEDRNRICDAFEASFSYLFPGPVEPVRPLRPWLGQKSCHLWSEPCNVSVQVGPIIVRLRFFSNGRTNLDLLPPLLLSDVYLKVWPQGHFPTPVLNS